MRREEIPYFAVTIPYEAAYRNCSTKQPVGAHMHNAVELYLTLTDLPDVLLNDAVCSVKSGTLIYIPPFCVHQLYHQKDKMYERYVLIIDDRWLETVLGDQVDSGIFARQKDPLFLPAEPEQLAQLREALDFFIVRQQDRTMGSVAELFRLLEVINRFACEVVSEPAKETNAFLTQSQKTVNAIIAYINENLAGGVTLQELAEHFYLNKDYLARLFMKHTHISVGQYTTMQRMAKAQELLRQGQTVSQVQEKMGYSSYAYFFKAFQKSTGISPSRYRAQYWREASTLND